MMKVKGKVYPSVVCKECKMDRYPWGIRNWSKAKLAEPYTCERCRKR